jgi:hypothetical protein
MRDRKYPTEWVHHPLVKDWPYRLRYDVDPQNNAVTVYCMGVQTRMLSRGLKEMGEYRHEIFRAYDDGEAGPDQRLFGAAKNIWLLLESAAWRQWYRSLTKEKQQDLYPAALK